MQSFQSFFKFAEYRQTTDKKCVIFQCHRNNSDKNKQRNRYQTQIVILCAEPGKSSFPVLSLSSSPSSGLKGVIIGEVTFTGTITDHVKPVDNPVTFGPCVVSAPTPFKDINQSGHVLTSITFFPLTVSFPSW